MQWYTYYFIDSGVINVSKSLLNSNEADLNTPEGCDWILGEYSSKEYCIVNGVPVSIPEKPNYPCYFDTGSMQWIWEDAISWRELRLERNKRLIDCDWTQVPDAPVNQAAWATYRQALRDLPDNTTDPRNPVWPEKPT